MYVNKISSVQDDKTILEAVPYDKQKQAMALLSEKVFANGSMNYDSKILANLVYERGTRSSTGNNDPDFHALVLSSQRNILRNILHPEVMNRLVNSSLYGNSYMPEEVLSDLNEAIFVSKEIPDTFKINLQATYVDLLIDGFNKGDYDNVSKAEIFQAINDIHSFARKNKMKSSHYELIFFKLEKLLNDS